MLLKGQIVLCLLEENMSLNPNGLIVLDQKPLVNNLAENLQKLCLIYRVKY